MRSIERVLAVDTQGTLSLVIDDDAEHVGSYYRMVDGLRNHPDRSLFGHVGKRIHGICFCNDESYPGIQAADMLAYISRDHMVKKRDDPNKLPSHLYQRITRNLLHQPHLMRGEILEEIVRKAAIAQKLANDKQ